MPSSLFAQLSPTQLLPKYQPSPSPVTYGEDSAVREIASQQDHFRSEMQQLHAQNSQLQSQVHSLNCQLDQVTQGQKLQDYPNQDIYQRKVETLQAENQKLQSLMTGFSAKMETLQGTQNQRAESEQLISQQRRDLQQLQDHNKILQKQLQTLEARFTQFQVRNQYDVVPVKEDKQYREKIESLENRNQQLSSHFQALTMRVEKMNDHSSIQEVAYTQEQEQRMITLQNQVERLQMQVHGLNGEIDVLKNELRKVHPNVTPEIQAFPKHPAHQESTESKNPVTKIVSTEPMDLEVPSLPIGDPHQMYNQALTFLNAREFDQAQRVLKDFIEHFPQDSLIVNAKYWLAETYYIQRKYSLAAQGFSDAYQAYKEVAKHGSDRQISVKAPEILLKIALTLKELGKEEDARITLQQLEREFPQAPANIKAYVQKLKQELKT